MHNITSSYTFATNLQLTSNFLTKILTYFIKECILFYFTFSFESHLLVCGNTLLFPTALSQVVKNLPPMQETGLWSVGREDPLEKEMATHSSILAWRIPWTEEPCGLWSTGLQRVGRDWSDLAPALPEVEYQLQYWDRREEDGVEILKNDTYFEKKLDT